MKQKTCKICKAKFEPLTSLSLVCSYVCSIEYGKLHLKKTELKKAKLKKAENKKKLLEIEPLSFWQNKLQTEINKIVKIIDRGLPCLATKKNTGVIHSGHVFSRGSTAQLRYNLHNIHRQSGQSNHFQSDDLKLCEGLINEYGKEYFEYLESSRNMSLNLSKEEIIQCIKVAKIYQKSVEREVFLDANDRILARNLGNRLIFNDKYKRFEV